MICLDSFTKWILNVWPQYEFKLGSFKICKITAFCTGCFCEIYRVTNEAIMNKTTVSQVSYRFLALGCFPANLVSDVVCVLFVLRVGSLKG